MEMSTSELFVNSLEQFPQNNLIMGLFHGILLELFNSIWGFLQFTFFSTSFFTFLGFDDFLWLFHFSAIDRTTHFQSI